MKDFQDYEMLDVIGELFSDEISIAVSDGEHYVYYRPSVRVDLKIKAGDMVKPGSLAHKALSSGQKVSDFINRDVFAVPYHGMAVPFHRDGKVVGSVTAIYPSFTEGKSVVMLKTQDGWVPVPFTDVKFLEVREKKTYIEANGVSGTHRKSLQAFEFILPRELFVRCHRSFIVNVHQIREVFPDTHSTLVLLMNDGTKIPVSQSYASYFRKLLDF
ncbi:LytTR family transcriptional regulator DNA-binding domain-containing protein [Paenisporosarcina sp. FSL H8-0542]|uniref:LytTR family transcriptional regulator DNA-binding domain-containing protein n=1 Tax=Paenisporosarcina sp. FSL H8-0542 TaxID=2921401 RepID=UPI003159F2C9